MSTQHEDKIDLAAFEEWARDHLGQGYPLTMDEGVYESPVTRWAFKAFKAGLALARKAQEPAVKAGWIAVEDQMPPMDEEVLVYCPNFGDGRIELDTWGEIRECPVSFSTESVRVGEGWENNEFEQVSHWMRKPEEPAKESTHV